MSETKSHHDALIDMAVRDGWVRGAQWRDARRLRNWLEQYANRKRTPVVKRERILTRTLPMAERRVIRRMNDERRRNESRT